MHRFDLLKFDGLSCTTFSFSTKMGKWEKIIQVEEKTFKISHLRCILGWIGKAWSVWGESAVFNYFLYRLISMKSSGCKILAFSKFQVSDSPPQE